MEIDELFKGKETIIKDTTFLDTKAYVEPFLDKMSKYTDDFRIEAILPKQLSITESPDIMYNRVWIQAVMPEKFFFEDNHKQVISMLYGLDVAKPVCKFYRGGLNMACTNLCVFDPDMLRMHKIKPNETFNYGYVDELLEREDKCKLFLQELHNNYITSDSRVEELGKWVDFALTNDMSHDYGKAKIPTATPIKAYKELFLNKKSQYYQTGDTISMFDVYNAFTQIFTDDKKDVMNKFEKTTLLNNLLQIK